MLKEVLPKAIIFDWDSTLVDNWQSIANALNATLIEMGKTPWTVTQVRQNSKNSARDAFPHIFGDHWKDALDFFYKAFRELHLTGIEPLPGAENLLRFLREEGPTGMQALPLDVKWGRPHTVQARRAGHVGADRHDPGDRQAAGGEAFFFGAPAERS